MTCLVIETDFPFCFTIEIPNGCNRVNLHFSYPAAGTVFAVIPT